MITVEFEEADLRAFAVFMEIMRSAGFITVAASVMPLEDRLGAAQTCVRLADALETVTDMSDDTRRAVAERRAVYAAKREQFLAELRDQEEK